MKGGGIEDKRQAWEGKSNIFMYICIRMSRSMDVYAYVCEYL